MRPQQMLAWFEARERDLRESGSVALAAKLERERLRGRDKNDFLCELAAGQQPHGITAVQSVALGVLSDSGSTEEDRIWAIDAAAYAAVRDGGCCDAALRIFDRAFLFQDGATGIPQQLFTHYAAILSTQAAECTEERLRLLLLCAAARPQHPFPLVRKLARATLALALPRFFELWPAYTEAACSEHIRAYNHDGIRRIVAILRPSLLRVCTGKLHDGK